MSMNLEQNLKEKGNVARLVNRLSKDISSMAVNQQNLQKLDVNLRKNFYNQRNVIACFSYVAQMEDELDLKEGDEIEIIDDIEDGWARGEIKNSPINPNSQGKIGIFPTNFVIPLNTTLPTTLNYNTTKEMAKVIYKYEAANPDELSLPEGALITVLNKSCEDEGWLEGEYNGKRGLFPENFVKFLDPIPVNEKPPAAIGLNLPNNAPTLPTKPLKAISAISNRHSIVSENQNLATQTPIATTRENFLPNGTTSHNTTLTSVANLISDTATSFPVTLNAKEERKSLVAGIQNKLFPAGKLPPFPNKQTFQLNNVNESVNETKTLEDLNEKLFSLTKNRPKQMNKRPPSLNISRNSAAKFSKNLETLSPEENSSSNAGQSLSTTIWNNNLSTTTVSTTCNNVSKKNNVQSSILSRNNVPTPLLKPKHLSFAVFTNFNQSNLPLSSSTTILPTTVNSNKLTTSFAPHCATTSVTSTYSTITSISSLYPSFISNKENNENEFFLEFVSRREFDLYRNESEKKIQELTQKIIELQKNFLNLR